jgi:hypothetical protein
MDSTLTTVPRRAHITGPIVLITLGIMLLLDQFVPGWGISKTWPLLLVVIGVMKLVAVSQPPRPPEGPRV